MDQLQKSDGNPAKSGLPKSESAFYHEGLTPSQERAVIALIESPSICAAARQSDVSERTLRRWLSENDQFKRSLRRAREQFVALATARLQTDFTARGRELVK